MLPIPFIIIVPNSFDKDFKKSFYQFESNSKKNYSHHYVFTTSTNYRINDCDYHRITTGPATVCLSNRQDKRVCYLIWQTKAEGLGRSIGRT